MTTKAKPAKLDPHDGGVLHVFHVRGMNPFKPKVGSCWKAATCDGRFRATGKTKKQTVARIIELMGDERELTGIITYRGMANPAEAAASLTTIHFEWKDKQADADQDHANA